MTQNSRHRDPAILLLPLIGMTGRSRASRSQRAEVLQEAHVWRGCAGVSEEVPDTDEVFPCSCAERVHEDVGLELPPRSVVHLGRRRWLVQVDVAAEQPFPGLAESWRQMLT